MPRENPGPTTSRPTAAPGGQNPCILEPGMRLTKTVIIDGIEYVPKPQATPEPAKTRGQVVADVCCRVNDRHKSMSFRGFLIDLTYPEAFDEFKRHLAEVIDAERKAIQKEVEDALNVRGWVSVPGVFD